MGDSEHEAATGAKRIPMGAYVDRDPRAGSQRNSKPAELSTTGQSSVPSAATSSVASVDSRCGFAYG